MFLKTLITTTIFSVSPLLAALPPLYQSIHEIKAVLNDPRLAESLGSAEPILEIVRTENGYEVQTLRYRMQIDRIPEAQAMPGPAQYRLEFHEPERVDARMGNS